MSNVGKRKAESALEDQSETEPVEEKQVPEVDPMSALATAAVEAKKSTKTSLGGALEVDADGHSEKTLAVKAKKTSPVDAPEEDTDRPIKKVKATIDINTEKLAKDAISDALDRLSKPSTLSDYEKCSIFPQKLMQLLKNEEAPDAIWWLEDGESFAIEQEQFTKVMNKVSRTSKKKVKLDSILRNLYRWGFKKLKDRDLPPNVFAYSHPKFKRGSSFDLQTFSKKSEPSPGGGSSDGLVPPPTALARALSARAQAGYGDNWNEEGAADKTTLMMNNHRYGHQHQDQQQASQFSLLHHHHHHHQQQQQQQQQLNAMMPDQRMMFMLQQQQHQQQYHHHQQQQRQMLLQQELMLHEQQQRHQQILLEAAAAEQYAAATAAGFPHHYPPTNPYPF